MVERKLRPAPSTLHLLPSRKPVRTGPSPSTQLFVLDGKGVLAREWRGVRVPGHVEEVLNFVKAL